MSVKMDDNLTPSEYFDEVIGHIEDIVIGNEFQVRMKL